MKKVGLLGLVLVLCLAVVGVGYAHWSKDLHVDGTVETGTFDAEMSQDPPWDNENKDVGIPDCTLLDNDQDGVYEAVELTIVGAYPSYEATFPLDVHCIGTVPLHINKISIEADPFLQVTISDENGPVTPGDQESPVQLHEGDAYWFDVTIHVLQQVGGETLPEGGATLTCSITITVDQWNYPYE